MRRLLPVTDQTSGRGPLVGTGGARVPTGASVPDDPSAQAQAQAPAAAPAPDREWSLDELADAYAYPADRDVWLRANMVSTLDGAAQHDGRSQPISSAADMRVFGTLRGLADVVVVGAETVRQEGYRPARAREAFAARRAADGQAPAPAVAVVSAGLDLDFSSPLFTEPLVPTLLVTGAGAPADRVAAARAAGVEIVIAGDGAAVDPARAVRALAERGLRRLLTEGGPRLLGQFVAARVLDELCLTVSPMLTAGAAQRIAGGPALTVPERFALGSLLEEDGFLFARYHQGRHSAE
ncbi:pyrimidine reductase family protein [Streptomyces sp. SID4919]|uniref:pyrimidine reductase family protein n=1 Tax=unclassified Streptomyces TaxID=2593676 RepID=UPI000823C0DB|nr:MULTISPECIES: pyrimidine reductase family protein [unclassified Streptomyces]MYY07569.1 pyrimidine reductase family protein [Streptomyces sp. SID4919]SCK51995.1 Pyrimidine reductase, riboflavin biosynthesis [Streptomyces sp. AmelKG-E11A]